MMKTTLFLLLMLCAGAPLRAEAPTVVSEASPLLETKGMVEILMADGSARQVRKILSMSPDALRVMTDGGIVKIPLDTLHPQSLTVLNSMLETPEQQQARLQKAASAAQSYRENQAMRERLAAEENAMIGAQQRAEAARQEAARQAAAEARARQFEQMKEQAKDERVKSQTIEQSKLISQRQGKREELTDEEEDILEKILGGQSE